MQPLLVEKIIVGAFQDIPDAVELFQRDVLTTAFDLDQALAGEGNAFIDDGLGKFGLVDPLLQSEPADVGADDVLLTDFDPLLTSHGFP